MTDTPVPGSQVQWTRFAALGDSITEGWCDPVIGMGEPWFGWADRLALEIDRHQQAQGAPRLEFANLGVRGRRVRHVVEDQIPEAIAMRADLVSVLIGGNDLSALRPDPDRLAAELETGIAQLARSGATVLLATAYDPGFSPYLRMLRGRAAVFTANVHAIAAKHRCRVLDLWTIPGLADRSMWSEDRLHPSTRGHLALLNAAASALGLPAPADADPGVGTRLPTSVWFRRHALPWIARRVRQVSSGDGRGPKLPVPTPVGVSRPVGVRARD
ncbi:SGNH/GDSL hydrolase family protein [Pseudolysinimonas sp.]|uniref:SGNH/GDSL hydrolase family protein n=1 Tax=Pseudolysinimonas sp. TaxID=2680009 RepID=UPI00286BC86E|nr:SGNH/GDSL hydrolase family protein [Pseudolysinimonas sp.]